MPTLPDPPPSRLLSLCLLLSPHSFLLLYLLPTTPLRTVRPSIFDVAAAATAAAADTDAVPSQLSPSPFRPPPPTLPPPPRRFRRNRRRCDVSDALSGDGERGASVPMMARPEIDRPHGDIDDPGGGRGAP